MACRMAINQTVERQNHQYRLRSSHPSATAPSTHPDAPTGAAPSLSEITIRSKERQPRGRTCARRPHPPPRQGELTKRKRGEGLGGDGAEPRQSPVGAASVGGNPSEFIPPSGLLQSSSLRH